MPVSIIGAAAAPGILIEQEALDSLSSTFTFDITSIPAGYDLFLSIKARQTGGTLGSICITFNGSGGTNYLQSGIARNETGGTVTPSNNGVNQPYVATGGVASTASPADAWHHASVKIPAGWHGDAVPCVYGESYTMLSGTSQASRQMVAGSYKTAIAVTSIEVFTNQGNFLVGSAARLYAVPAGMLG